MTVLANEQVIDGRGWRSDALVERRKLIQWFLRITDYADELLEGLKTLDRWPDKVRLMQENWIGESQGPAPDLPVRRRAAGRASTTASRSTPRGRTPCSARASSRCRPTIRWPSSWRRPIRASPAFVEECRKGGTSEAEIETAEKLGFDTGLQVAHPFDPDWRLPVWIANFVLMDYGTGAIFGCPAHDQRDLDFARKYALPVTPVVLPPGADPATLRGRHRGLCRARAASINSGFMDGMDIEAAKAAAIAQRRSAGPGRGRDGLSPARLGHRPPARLGLPDPGGPLRRVRHRRRCQKPSCR